MAVSFEALRRLLRHIGRLLLLRAEMAAEEFSLLQRQWIGWLVIALAAVALLAVAVAGAGAFLTLVLWERFGAATLGVLALALALLAFGLLYAIARSARAAAPPLAQTRTALREDYEALAGVVADEPNPGPPQ